ncbi:MAG: acyl-coenzyme A thioesterase PaaI-like protein [Arenicella sp.]|jgi:acyl-coenzyme A thioesterase PaaI-like protein
MSFYQKAADIGKKFIKPHKLFKFGFNWSPMYKRSTGKITSVSEDLMEIKMKLKISYKNRNYMGSIFGGSLFASVDPVPMVQLIQLLGKDYVVWDKSAQIAFRRPAKEHLFAEFTYTLEELENIKKEVAANKEYEMVKLTALKSKDGTITYCEVAKTIYIADKAYFKEKRANKKA